MDYVSSARIIKLYNRYKKCTDIQLKALKSSYAFYAKNQNNKNLREEAKAALVAINKITVLRNHRNRVPEKRKKQLKDVQLDD